MRNLTVRERIIIVGAILVFVVGAGHRYYSAKSAAADAISSSE